MLNIVDSYTSDFKLGYKLVTDINKSAETRVVWFVGIAGYALLNASSYLKAMSGQELTGKMFLLLTFPWMLTMIAGIVTHWLLGGLTHHNNFHYLAKIAALSSLRLRAQDGSAQPQDLLNIVENNVPQLNQFKVKADRLSPWVRWMERLTFVSLGIGFLWAGFGVFICL